MVAEALAAEIRRRYLEPRERLGMLPGDPVFRSDCLPTMAQLAREYGVSVTQVWCAVRGRSSERPSTGRRGEGRLGHLTEHLRRSILAAYAAGVPVVVISEAFGVGRATIWDNAQRAGLARPRGRRPGTRSGITAAQWLAEHGAQNADSCHGEARSATEGPQGDSVDLHTPVRRSGGVG